jgi:hypothetical protein
MPRTRKLWPPKYYRGLSARTKTRRRKEIEHFSKYHWKDPRAYEGFKTDRGVKGKPSSYTQKWRAEFPRATSLKAKSEVTGVPLKYIKKSFNRGMAAWRTGHRPGATEQQWGYARAHSFLLCGKTYRTTDSDLAREAKARSKTAKAWWSKRGC